MKIDPNAPAYPTPSGHAQVIGIKPGEGDFLRTVEICTTGMTIRTQIAAGYNGTGANHCVQEYLRIAAINEPERWGKDALAWSDYHMRRIADIEVRYRTIYADALIAELNK